jgi:hypothetical protein
MTQTFGQMASKLRGGIKTSEKEELITKVVVTLEAAAIRLAPSKSGTLRRSIAHEVTPGGESGRVGTNLSYAGAVISGSAPHIITPKNAKVLAFRAGSAQVFARVVHHPGTKPQPFFDDALEASGSDIDRLTGDTGLQIVARWAADVL